MRLRWRWPQRAVVTTGSILTGSILTGSILTGSILTGSILTGALLADHALAAASVGIGATAAHATDVAPVGPTEPGWVVQRVVDGDTVSLTRAGQRLRVRLIGIDTPETVRPNTPVACFGPQATAYAQRALEGRLVTVEFDPSQGRTDRFGRTLAYLWIDGAHRRMFNADAIAAGMAREYTYAGRPYAWQGQFRGLEQRAKGSRIGLWGACAPSRQ